MSTKKYTFGEKDTEYSSKDGRELPVWKSPKYENAKKAVINMLESDEYKDVLDESDFWILMNSTKTGKMAYSGLIISHNGCLKINDTLPEELKFNPKYLSIREPSTGTYKDSLIFIYNSGRIIDEEDKQMLYEIGEVSQNNCKNDYPYAMALKRCMDRVILKNSKLAYSGIYSDSEAEEFSANYNSDSKKESIENLTKEIAEQLKFTKGKHKDETYKTVYETDKQYLEWALNNTNHEYTKQAISLVLEKEILTDEEADTKLKLLNELNNCIEETESVEFNDILVYYDVKTTKDLSINQLKDAIEKIKNRKK
jgi:hypothetical protein